MLFFLLACAPLTEAPGNGKADGDGDDSMVSFSARDTGPTPWSGLSGQLQLEVGFREDAAGVRDCTLVWNAENAVPIDRCASCDFAFELTWALDDAASSPGEHCMPLASDLPMALGLMPGSRTPVWTAEPGAPLAPWTPAQPLLQEDEAWAFVVGEADVRREDGGYDTALWQGIVRPE